MLWERGKNSEAFYFPAKSGRKRSGVLAVQEIWPSCKGLFCFSMQTDSTTPLEIHGDAYTFSKLSSPSELLVTVLTPHYKRCVFLMLCLSGYSLSSVVRLADTMVKSLIVRD